MLTVLLLALYTGQRRQDLVRMTWKDFQGSIIRVRQNKTGEPLMIPCHKDLRAHLEGLSARFGPIIRAADGKTLNANALSSAMNRRSEEHTSELQALMRNSYAVFCLKKKTKN